MKFVADLHIHTVSSGHAYNTIYDYAAAAKKLGLKIIGMTDHGPQMPGGPHLYHFQNLRALPAKIHGVRVLKGVEANIIDPSGKLDIPQDTLDDLELVIVSFHRHLGYDGGDIDENTKAMIGAINNPKVNIVGHAGNPQFPINFEAVVEACMKNRVLIEINNSSFTGVVRIGSYERCLEIAKIVKRIGWKVIFSSDTHCVEQLATFEKAIKLAKEAGLTADDIVNTSEKMVLDYVINKWQ